MNWQPNLFAKLVNYLQISTSPDVIRMGIIAGIRTAAPTEDEVPTTWDKKELETQNISIAKAVEIVLPKYDLPQTIDSILNDIIQYRPDTKEDSLRAILVQLRRGPIVNYYEGGLIGIKGKRYGRGYKVVDRLQKVKPQV